MLDIAIIGGGVCGLALARRLQQAGRAFALYEARARCGGRVLSVPLGPRLRADLGASWFWPRTQPRMSALVTQLGLGTFPQHDNGTVLSLDDPEKPVRATLGESVHQGALRLRGGMASLVEALAAALPADRMFLDHALQSVRLQADHVELEFLQAGRVVAVQARRVVLALPPRLAAERLRFEPALDPALREALQDTATWMAAQARAVLAYEQAAWRSVGQSGNAFVRHEQAVFGEIHDACETPDRAALGGFLALPPALRRSFQAGLPMLMSNQMMQLFGGELQETAQQYQDWAEQAHTCSSLDLALHDPQARRAECGHALLREPQWRGHLFFGGSETASVHSGQLEGALEAADRLAQLLPAALPGDAGDPQPPAPLQEARHADPNAAGLAAFSDWVRQRQPALFEDYRRRINLALARQQREQLAQLALLDTVEKLFADALAQLASLPFDTAGLPVEQGRCALTPRVQAAFHGCLQQLLEEAKAFNRTSCALSNFPGEAQLPHAYEQVILRDIAAAWREFSIEANFLLLDRGAAATIGLEAAS